MSEAQRGRWTAFIEPTIVGVIGAAVSLWRILAANPTALSSLLWAEDGLFPLCVRKAGLASCLVDPFAGYLLFWPRAVAGIVSAFPLSSWAMAANICAAVLAGLVSAFCVVILRRQGVLLGVSAFIALLPVLAPIVGFEAINATGSSYMPLLFVMSIALAFPRQERLGVWWHAVGLLITALTIPSAIVLYVAIAVQVIRRQLGRRNAAIMSVALLLGLVGQFTVALSAQNRRSIAITWDALVSWVEHIPDAVLTFWPGLTFGEGTVFGQFTVTPFLLTGWLLVAALLGLGGYLAFVGRGRNIGIGVLLLLGLGIGAIPSLTGYANNRYFVVPVLLWAAAGLVALDGAVKTRRVPILSTVIAAILIVWWPAFSASAWRAGSTPDWQAEVDRIAAVCAADPSASVEVHFTPDWPTPQESLTEPTTNVATCAQVS